MTKKIKLLYITQCYGGVGIYIKNIIENINKAVFSLEVIGPYNKEFINYCSNFDIPFHTLEISRGISIRNDIKAFFLIRKMTKKIKPDIIHLHSSKAGMIGRIALHSKYKNIIFTPHGLSYMSFNGLKRILFMICEIFAKRYTNRILTCSYSEKFKLNFEIGIPNNQIDVLLNSIPIPKERSIKRNFNKTDVIHIGSIMRLTTQKNPLMYIETAKLLSYKYKNIHFSILGSGLTDDLKDIVLDKINEYNLTDKFDIIEWGEQEKSSQYLDSLDIFILPSLFEGLPLAPIEAMSKNVPCVLSKGDGCSDLIENGINGFSCITPEQYVKSISKLIENPELRIYIRDNAFIYINKYHNIREFIKKIEAYYSNIIN